MLNLNLNDISFIPYSRGWNHRLTDRIQWGRSEMAWNKQICFLYVLNLILRYLLSMSSVSIPKKTSQFEIFASKLSVWCKIISGIFVSKSDLKNQIFSRISWHCYLEGPLSRRRYPKIPMLPKQQKTLLGHWLHRCWDNLLTSQIELYNNGVCRRDADKFFRFGVGIQQGLYRI